MSFKYSFHINDNDYYEFSKFHTYNTPLIKRRILKARILLPFFMLILPFILGRNNPEESYVFHGIFAIMALAVFIFYNQITNFSLKRNIKKIRKTGKMHYENEITYEFLEDSFTEKTCDSESIVKYSMLEKLSSGTNAFYLYANVQSAYILPFRVFTNEQERKEFLDFIQGKVSNTSGKK